jgi:SAM-dependent methyltransferase
MTSIARIIESPSWLLSPAGQYLLAWEQAQLDRLVADIFGFHALQLGRPALDALRSNRMPHRWLLNDVDTPVLPAAALNGLAAGHSSRGGVWPAAGTQRLRRLDVSANFEALPFPTASLDLVVLPHTLELADDAHQTLREVERVLMPEGRVVVIGFNPTSLWGLAGQCRRVSARFGHAQVPAHGHGELIGPRRLRDWFKLLGLQVETGTFGCWRPPWTGEPWLERNRWMESAGERWWPFFGSLYAVVAVKRVRAMRLIGPAWKQQRRKGAAGAPAVLTPQRSGPMQVVVPDTAGPAAAQPPHARPPGSIQHR